jgi:hypothetical protein
MASHHTRQQLVRLAWGYQGDPAKFDPKPLFAEIKACAGVEGRHLARALPKLWKNLDYPGYDGMHFARATRLTSEAFEALMGILSKGQAKTILDYRFPASPAAMLFVALAVGRFSLRYHGGNLAAKPEGFWYPPHIGLTFARVWPNHLSLDLYVGLLDSLMNLPSGGLLDYDSMTVGRVEPMDFVIDDETKASYGGEDGAIQRPRDDKAEDFLRQVQELLSAAGGHVRPRIFRDPSAAELHKASSLIVAATAWDGANDGRPLSPQGIRHDPKVLIDVLGAALVVAAYLRNDGEVLPVRHWNRAKLVIAMASIWPAALDVGIFDLLMENIYARSDFDYDNIVGVI